MRGALIIHNPASASVEDVQVSPGDRANVLPVIDLSGRGDELIAGISSTPVIAANDALKNSCVRAQ
jgi:hypothetical protein